MVRYYVNMIPQLNGDHEVHRSTCNYLPRERIDLGEHNSCHTAVDAARAHYWQSNGCVFCAPACHTS